MISLDLIPSRYRILYKHQWGRCYLCGRFMGEPRIITSDHVTPKKLARKGLKGNRLLAHMKCNFKKADRRPRPCELIYLGSINVQIGHQWEARQIEGTL